MAIERGSGSEFQELAGEPFNFQLTSKLSSKQGHKSETRSSGELPVAGLVGAGHASVILYQALFRLRRPYSSHVFGDLVGLEMWLGRFPFSLKDHGFPSDQSIPIKGISQYLGQARSPLRRALYMRLKASPHQLEAHFEQLTQNGDA